MLFTPFVPFVFVFCSFHRSMFSKMLVLWTVLETFAILKFPSVVHLEEVDSSFLEVMGKITNKECNCKMIDAKQSYI